jgi:hypothetical protein
VAAIEMAVYRLAVPGLKPTNPADSPPIWHTALSYWGLFLSYFGSALAVGIILRQLILFARGHHQYWKPVAYALILSGAAFTTYAVKSLVSAPGEEDTLFLELGFSVTLILLVVAQLRPGGDVAAKVGLMLLAAPLLVHFYRDAGVRWILGDMALVSGIPERIAAYGQWTMVLAALLTPYCFAPRPFIESAGRLAPLVIGGFVGVVGALVMRQSAEVGVKIAADGLGVDLGSGPPASQIALYLIALGSITWTLVACFIAPSAARRRIGVGLGLVVAAGYGFDWPLQYLVGLVGFLTIGEAVREVVGEERSARAWEAARFRTPPIAAETWHAYVVALVEALRARGLRASTVSVAEPALLAQPGADASSSSASSSSSAASSSPGPAAEPHAGGEGGDVGPAAEDTSRTHVLITDSSAAPVRLLVERVAGAVQMIEVVCGRDARPSGEAPVWTVEARPERRLARVAHPTPPRTGAPHVRTGDATFDRRFHMRDGGGHAARLLDDGMRARASALLDGWLAYWPERALVYRVVPGHGAPLDNPIPISELAFRGAIWDGAVDRLVTVLEFLTELSRAAITGDAARAGSRADGDAAGESLDSLPAAGDGDRYGST